MPKALGRPDRLLMLFGAASLAAVVIGAVVCSASGVPAGSWVRDVVAWMVGAVLAGAVARFARPGFSRVALWALPIGLLATLISPDQEGVHRWVDLGPLHVNVAMLLAPGAVVALAASADQRLSWAAFVLSLALLVVQPDASQATSLAVVVAMIALWGTRRPLIRWGAPVVAAGLATAAWLRPDPLQPAPEVEGVIGLAFSISPLLAGAAVLALAAVAAAPALSKRLPAVALGLCFLLWSVMSMLGAFPVPWVGIGMSAIVGGWLGVGLLAAWMRWNGGAEPAKASI